MGAVVVVAVVAVIVWSLVSAARRTDAPWWKIWLFGRGIVPTAQEIRDAEDRQRFEEGPAEE